MTEHNTKVEELIADLKRAGALNNPRYEAAFRSVDRRRFLPETQADAAYQDRPVPLVRDVRQNRSVFASKPSALIGLLDMLQLEPGMSVLEIGTGTGYFSALIRVLLEDHGQLVTIEINPELARQAQENLGDQLRVLTMDGADGFADAAPYDRIITTAAIWDMPSAWIKQLRPGGWIVAPVFLDGVQVCTTFHVLEDQSLVSGQVMPGGFGSLRGDLAGPSMRKHIGSTAMSIIADQVDQFDAVSLATLLVDDYDSMLLSVSLDSARYWHGFVPYVMISEVPDQIFALYHIDEGLAAFGIEGEGFALLTPASACFVPYHGNGQAHCYAGADAFLQLEAHLKNWQANGQPGLDRLRLRFCPKGSDFDSQSLISKVYPRREHDLHVWMDVT